MTLHSLNKYFSQIPIFKVWLAFYTVVLSLSWLLPGHYMPWTGFQGDAWIAVILLLGASFLLVKLKSDLDWNYTTILIGALALMPMIQYSIGLLAFAGQAWISTLYIFGFLFALLMAERCEKSYPELIPNILLIAISIAAVLSVLLQFQTWFEILETGIFDIWSMGLIDNRPYANFGQPNLLATFLIWGCIAIAWAYLLNWLNATLALVLICFLLLGVSLTESRTAWIGISFLLCCTWFWRKLWPSTKIVWAVSALFLFFWTCPFLLKSIREALLLDVTGRLSRTVTDGNMRLDAWTLFMYAAFEQPWFGYGWSEVFPAQISLAAKFPSFESAFGHSHNLFLDLILWVGLPIGICVSLYIVWLMISYFRAVKNAKEALLVMLLSIVGIHALLEFPLHYAYFLLPTGLVMGVVHARFNVKTVYKSNRRSLSALYLVIALLLGLTIRDYFIVENGFRVVRFEKARIGTAAVSLPPDVILLTQLRERIVLMRYEVNAGMGEAELDWLLKVVSLQPSGAPAYIAAKALALNNRPNEAQKWLEVACKISKPKFCELIKKAWAEESSINLSMANISLSN